MRNSCLYGFLVLFLLLAGTGQRAYAGASSHGEAEDGHFDIKEVIFHHLGDAYCWEMPWGGELFLPVIVQDDAGKWYCFSSKHLLEGEPYKGFFISHEEKYEGKIVGRDATGEIYRPWDFSITKNVLALIFGALFTALLAFTLARYYKRHHFKAPRKGVGFLEMIVEMVYVEVIVEVLGKDARRYGPYLLTLFFFILIARRNNYYRDF